MKLMLSILLSFHLLVSGFPLADHTENRKYSETEITAEMKETDPQIKQANKEGKIQDSYISAASQIENLEQNKAEKILTLKENETLENVEKKGYTTAISRSIACSHTALGINGSMKCLAAPKPLNPEEHQLKRNVVLTGLLEKKAFTAKVENYDAGGKENTVAHKRLKVTMKDIPEIEPAYLASPYLCPDGNAGYAYYEFHFSYCPNTEKFYKVQESHVWLGCTRGDGGIPEFHPKQLKHSFYVYKFVPNRYKVVYNANGGTGTISDQNAVYNEDFILRQGTKFKRNGYTLTEWNTKSDGSGIAYKLGETVKNLSAENGEVITLYAQWQPNVYTVALDNQLINPIAAGTDHLYKKYETGIFLDNSCRQSFTGDNPIVVPQKSGYLFQGYYDSKTGGKQMIDRAGKPTAEGLDKKKCLGDEIWYARYGYLVGCEDYADIPCDLEKTDEDNREDLGVRLIYNRGSGKVTIYTGKTGCIISLTGKPAGTRIGNFQSTKNASSAFGSTGRGKSVEATLNVENGTAFHLKITRYGEKFCDHLVYYENGRFRMLAKLGTLELKEAVSGSSLAGSAWNSDKTEYDLYQYYDCSELDNIQAPGTVQRYFRYKDINMAYTGDGATAGCNVLEYDVSLENFYQFRDNTFTKEKIEKKYTKDQKEYRCKVKYGFQGWEMAPDILYTQKRQDQLSKVYQTAKREKILSFSTKEDINTYQVSEPVQILSDPVMPYLQGKNQRAQQTKKETGNTAVKSIHAKEYINLKARWNAFPTIVVNPEDKLEFYEGEEVTKDKLVSHLTAHDAEDNHKDYPYMNDKICIKKISYPESKNKSQKAYEKIYKVDVPEDFLLDTYYLKLEKNESVDVLVTFAVTDSTGNTTEEEFPVKVKYNNYPQIHSENIFYYLKEEADKGEITEKALLARASAEDIEDGDITSKLRFRDFDPQNFKMQTEAKAIFAITYQVTDAYKKTTYKTIKVMVLDGDAAAAEMPKYYVRYISKKYLNTLENNSIWREPQNLEYLKSILNNKTPMETWVFTHEDILAVQNWIMKGQKGDWKIGQEANREFLAVFAHCRQ
ncbi:MAG: InlB B-repeat-containing protein [Lachnospiraceae bacterium]|nr:InlB B-repeat-containing protein [Lachnospiraceae bacterium]